MSRRQKLKGEQKFVHAAVKTVRHLGCQSHFVSHLIPVSVSIYISPNMLSQPQRQHNLNLNTVAGLDMKMSVQTTPHTTTETKH